MAFFDCHFFSDALGLSVSAHVLLPQKSARQIGMAGAAQHTPPSGGYPTLTLLHGLSDDHTIWMRRTSIERYAAERNLAVVMPAAGRSYYQDMASGAAYWTFISEELPQIMRGFFPLSSAREHNFVAGLSMGGYGALRLALAFPERYAAAASLSGALDVARRAREAGRKNARVSLAEMQAIFGPELQVEGTSVDLFHLAQQVATSGAPRPQLHLACGTDDGLLAESRAFRKHLQLLKWEPTYHEGPGAHEWSVWDADIQRVLQWLPIPSPEGAKE
jgi:putative tributyrin esterase